MSSVTVPSEVLFLYVGTAVLFGFDSVTLDIDNSADPSVSLSCDDGEFGMSLADLHDVSIDKPYQIKYANDGFAPLALSFDDLLDIHTLLRQTIDDCAKEADKPDTSKEDRASLVADLRRYRPLLQRIDEFFEHTGVEKKISD